MSPRRQSKNAKFRNRMRQRRVLKAQMVASINRAVGDFFMAAVAGNKDAWKTSAKAVIQDMTGIIIRSLVSAPSFRRSMRGLIGLIGRGLTT